MAESQLQLAVITGSVRARRIASGVASWLTPQLGQHGEIGIDAIDSLTFSCRSVIAMRRPQRGRWCLSCAGGRVRFARPGPRAGSMSDAQACARDEWATGQLDLPAACCRRAPLAAASRRG